VTAVGAAQGTMKYGLAVGGQQVYWPMAFDQRQSPSSKFLGNGIVKLRQSFHS
jgi:hypothetical protein